MGIKKLLFYIYDISDRKTISSLVKEKEEILDAFLIYILQLLKWT